MASMRQVSEETLNLIKYFEGLHKVYGNTIIPYRDAIGFWTIGYGHLITRDRSLKPFPKDYVYPVIIYPPSYVCLIE